MKKIFLFLSILIALGVVTNSCMYEKVDEGETPEPPGPGPTDEYIYFIRLIPGSMQGQKPYAMDWSAYRSVGFFLHGEEDGHSVYSNKKLNITTESGNGNVLLFDTIVSSDTKGVGYAYAPHQSFSGTTVLSGVLSGNQNQVINTDGSMDETLRSNMVLVAAPVSFSFDQGTCQLQLNNIFSLIRLTISKSPSLAMNNRRVKSIKLYIADKDNIMTPVNSAPLSGSYTIDLKNSGSVPQFTSPSYTVAATITDSYVTIEKNPVAWLMVNPFTLKANEKLVAYIETNGGDYFYSSFDLNTVKNYVYDITAVASKENTYVESTSEKYINTYSNCYIVSEKGKYQFPANRTIGGQPISGSSVDWLWASKEGGGGSFHISELINTSSLVYDGTNIVFQVGDKNPFSEMRKGNVVLALKNASNEIVWTWHIWITDSPQEVKYEGNGIFLDRNIGALSANMVSTGIDNYGFVYQWGRKDPFFGGDGMTNETTANMLSVARNNTIVNTGASWSVNTTTGTIDMATKNPMKFICNNSSSKDQPADWLSVSNPNLWSATGKTDYDPCPYGYKVPGKSDLRALHNAAQNELIYFTYQGHRHWNYYYYSGGSVTAWPAAGMRQGRSSFNGNNGAQLLYSGTDADDGKCIYWTSSPINIGGSTLSGGSHRVYTSGSMLYSEDDYGDNADAYPVRCVKMANP